MTHQGFEFNSNVIWIRVLAIVSRLAISKQVKALNVAHTAHSYIHLTVASRHGCQPAYDKQSMSNRLTI